MPLVLKEWPTDVVRSINNARNGLTAETDNFRIDEDMPYKVNRDARLEPVPRALICRGD
jgi:hypothetical protein